MAIAQAFRTIRFNKKYAPFSFSRFSMAEQIFFVKRLSFLLSAGVLLPQALAIIVGQGRKSRRQAAYQSLLAEIENGQPLAHALRSRLPGFSHLGFALIRMGEVSGTLAASLLFLGDALEKKQALRRKVLSALAYPAIIAMATLGITVFLIVYIFPKITPIFVSLHVALPITTRVLMASANFLSRFGIVAAIALLLVGGAIAAARKKSRRMQDMSERALLALPLFGTLARAYLLANACRMLAVLLESAMPLVPALAMVSEALPNIRYRQALGTVTSEVRAGETLAAGLGKYPALFPGVMTQLIAIGEQAGNLQETLQYLAELYENEVDTRAKNLSTALEPLLMLAMGLTVGFVAISIITPIYGITGQLSTH